MQGKVYRELLRNDTDMDILMAKMRIDPEKFLILPASFSTLHPETTQVILQSNQKKIIFVVFWCRSHWALLVKRPDDALVYLYDSAKSTPVLRTAARFVAPGAGS